MDSRPIVVGTDGSEPSLAALRWAAAEAQLRRTELRVVLAYHWRVPGARFVTSEELQRFADEQAQTIVDAAVAEARIAVPGLTVRGAATLGDPAPVLLDAASDAQLLAVGSRGRGGFAGLLLGSVATAVATHAPCPAIVVRGRTTAAHGPIVVGVDGSAPADVALGLAFEEAATRRCALRAVMTYTVPLPAWPVAMPPSVYDPSTLTADLDHELTRQVGAWSAKYPQVPVERALVEGSAGAVLAQESRQAQLLVAGTRGHGGLTGLLLGSVGQQLLHHADCPVLIAR